MSVARLFRLIQYWISLPLFLTVAMIASTGATLALKKDFAALQPPTRAGSAPGDLSRPVQDLVRAATPDWRAVERIDIRPQEGVAKVILHDRTEVQVDLASGRVLQTGYRTSDWLETLHDFSIFGGWAKYVFSFGTGLLLLAMVVTGAYLFLLPMLAKRRRARASPSRR